MTDLDPYGDWLGIVASRKPTYYELLQIESHETRTSSVLRAAAIQLQKLEDVRPETAAQKDALAKLRRRIQRAAHCLADESLRIDYDQRLERLSASGKTSHSKAVASQVTAEGDRFSEVFPTREIRAPRTKLSRQIKKQRNRDRAIRNSMILAGLSLVGLLFLVCTQTPQGRSFVRTMLRLNDEIAMDTVTEPRKPAATDRAAGADGSTRSESIAEAEVKRTGGIEGSPPDLSTTSNRAAVSDGAGETDVTRASNDSAPAETPDSSATSAATNTMSEATEPVEALTKEMNVIDEVEFKKLATLLTNARQALSRQKMEQAGTLLQEAESMAKRPADVEKVGRLLRLTSYVEAYWEAANDGLRQLQSGSELTIGGEPVFVVQRTAESLVLRAAGRNRTYQCKALPVPLRVLLAERWFDSNAASTNVFRGAMMSVTPGYEFAEASRQWKVAEAAGKLSQQDRLDLERAATEDYGMMHSKQ